VRFFRLMPAGVMPTSILIDAVACLPSSSGSIAGAALS
jgi:hypothetical protein